MLDSKLQKAVYPASTRITDEKRRQLQRTKQDFFNSESGDTSYSFAITYMQGNDPIIGPEEKETTVFQLNPNQLEIDDPNTHFMVWSHGNDTFNLLGRTH